MFVGIQHPREGLKGSVFPYGKTTKIWCDDDKKT
ncbi:hypothetical protein cje89_08731 [Campylobacter jejuni subsp. jejuni LMG 9872]|nr:hypothetical protein cje89_08731 [Campylobacter jejuni subsp. jejuni LMG 9872]CAH1483780.1 hypothetical protein H529L_00112 [Campylobacter jejuni]